jgi:alpha-tubulin suppressor-like RCC1 family protein
MSAGYSTSRAIKTNGEMWSWGYNGSGNSGVNNITHYSSPVQVPGTTWAVTAGTSYGEYAIRTDGTLWTWGYNVQGCLGLNQAAPVKISSPTQIPGTTWSKIACGERNAFALKTDGTMWSWGRNETGWLGLNEGANPGPSKSSPCQIGSDTTWTSNYAVTYQGALAIKTDGTLWSWGKNNNGSLGHNNQTDYSSPTQVGSESTWSSVNVSGEFKVRAIKTDGTLWSWGYNHKGQLGLNDTTQRSSPTQVGSDNDWTKLGGTGARTSYAMRGL